MTKWALREHLFILTRGSSNKLSMLNVALYVVVEYNKTTDSLQTKYCLTVVLRELYQTTKEDQEGPS